MKYEVVIKDGGLSFETQLKIEFLPQSRGSKKCLGKPLHSQSYIF